MAQKKEEKKDKKVQVRDLKPRRDAKGGGGHSGYTGGHSGYTGGSGIT